MQKEKQQAGSSPSSLAEKNRPIVSFRFIYVILAQSCSHGTEIIGIPMTCTST